MTFADFETSTSDSAPLELYTFQLGELVRRYTTGSESVTVDGETYEPAVVSREALSADPESRTNALSIRLMSDNDLVRQFINNVPGQRMRLQIARVHWTDTGADTSFVFRGTVRSVSFTADGSEAEIAVMPISGDLDGSMPRFVYSRTCNHFLYDSRCKVDPEDFRFDGEVSEQDRTMLTVPGLHDPDDRPDGWADAGFVTMGADFRLILRQEGDEIRVLTPFPQDATGASVVIHAGCDRSPGTCIEKFDNFENYGGFPFVPLKNPFDTSLDSA